MRLNTRGIRRPPPHRARSMSSGCRGRIPRGSAPSLRGLDGTGNRVVSPNRVAECHSNLNESGEQRLVSRTGTSDRPKAGTGNGTGKQGGNQDKNILKPTRYDAVKDQEDKPNKKIGAIYQ